MDILQSALFLSQLDPFTRAVLDGVDVLPIMPQPDYERWANPAAIAETLLFLASTSNAVTTGALVPVYGRTA